jgi:hypothetical protein
MTKTEEYREAIYNIFTKAKVKYLKRKDLAKEVKETLEKGHKGFSNEEETEFNPSTFQYALNQMIARDDRYRIGRRKTERNGRANSFYYLAIHEDAALEQMRLAGLISDPGSSSGTTVRQIEVRLEFLLECKKNIPRAELDPFPSRTDVYISLRGIPSLLEEHPYFEWLAGCVVEGKAFGKTWQNHKKALDEFYDANERLTREITSMIESELDQVPEATDKTNQSNTRIREKDAFIHEQVCSIYWRILDPDAGVVVPFKGKSAGDFCVDQEKARGEIMKKLEEPEIASLAKAVLTKYKEVSEIRSEIDKGLKNLRHRIEWDPELLRNAR